MLYHDMSHLAMNEDNALAYPPEVRQILKFFAFSHLPAKLQEVSKPFCLLAEQVADKNPSSPETLMGLRKLLEAKDCAVRAAL